MLKKKTVRRVVVKVKAASRLTTRPILTFPVQFQNPVISKPEQEAIR